MFTLSDSQQRWLRQAGAGDGQAEKRLLRALMPQIYAYPRIALSAPEEVQAEFLAFAMERLLSRRALGKYDAAQASFATWFSVVLHRLYLDWLRTRPDEPVTVWVAEDDLPAGEDDPRIRAQEEADASLAGDMLAAMELPCRVTFKLLAAEADEWLPAEVEWVCRQTGMAPDALARQLAEGEKIQRDKDAERKEESDRLRETFWKLRQAEETLRRSASGSARRQELEEMVCRKRNAFRRQRGKLAGRGVTMPYPWVAGVLGVSEKTLSSRISRCREQARLLWQSRKGEGA